MIEVTVETLNPTREVYWNVSSPWLMYVLLIPTLLVFGYGLYRHYRFWRLGLPEKRFDCIVQRLRGLLVYAIGQLRLFKNSYDGFFHIIVFSSFGVLLIGTLVVMIQEDFGLPILQGKFYLYFQSLTLDIFGFFAMAGILMAVYRRYVLKPARLNNRWQDAAILGSLLLILLTGFMIEGLRIGITGDPWAKWSPVGLFTSNVFGALLPARAIAPLHAFLWWFHLLLVFVLIAWLPYSKLLHIFTATANIYFRSLAPNGAMLKPMDTEAAAYGVNSLDQFTWKDLLDLECDV
ncbi:respiratory nitrate reductase subunit gamma [Thermodesulfobacteriota bacterium]